MQSFLNIIQRTMFQGSFPYYIVNVIQIFRSRISSFRETFRTHFDIRQTIKDILEYIQTHHIGLLINNCEICSTSCILYPIQIFCQAQNPVQCCFLFLTVYHRVTRNHIFLTNIIQINTTDIRKNRIYTTVQSFAKCRIYPLTHCHILVSF